MKIFYFKLHDQIVRNQRVILSALGVLWVGAVVLVSQMQFDMSFRPLFADEDAMYAPTERFEAVFGEASGAYIGVILESEDILTQPYLRGLARVSDQVAQLQHVTAVISLTHFDFPIWTPTGSRTARLIPKSFLNSETPENSFLEKVRSHPKIKRVILSEDGKKTLLLARVNIPLKDLKGRRPVIRQFKKTVVAGIPLGTTMRFTGVSVVEEGYADIVLWSSIRSTVLTSTGLVLALFLFFGRLSSIAVALAGVSIASPITLALLHLIGQKITIINSMVPIMLLIIGVADAIHMEQSFMHYRNNGRSVSEAVRRMFGAMALPCLMTTVTTTIGFLSLRMANIGAIRDFGLNVGIGVVVVYLMNILLVPIVLLWLPSKQVGFTRWAGRGLEYFLNGTSRLVTGHAGKITFAFATFIAICVWLLPKLSLDQKFNEEVAADHPIRLNQALLDQEFTGFLGPEISVRPKKTSNFWSSEAMDQMRKFQDALREHPDVLHIRTYLDYLPEGMPHSSAQKVLSTLRKDSPLKYQVQEVINQDGKWASVIVRTNDMGTKRAGKFKDWIEEISIRHLGTDFEVEVVGQWWLAQRGMMNILSDMLWSFITACILILPIMALLLRSIRLFLVSLLPNLLPMLAALAFMAAAGISIRIGTAMILAIALGIAIDDTIHLMIQLREHNTEGKDRKEIVLRTLAQTGKAILYTSVVLVIGFGSMLSNELIAIQDMGIVAAVTIIIALISDLYLAPALYLLSFGVLKKDRFQIR